MSEPSVMPIVNVNMPTELVLRHQTDRVTEEQQQQAYSDNRVAKSAWLLKKMENEQKIKELEPEIQTKVAEFKELDRQINEAARTIIGDMKLSDVFDEVKKALKQLKIHNLSCSIELGEVNIELGTIAFTRVVGTDKYGTKMTGYDQVKFTPEMRELRKQWFALAAGIKELEAIVVKAKVNLQDRANTLADIEGVLAIKSLNDSEREKTLSVYESLKQDVSVTKLIGGKI